MSVQDDKMVTREGHFLRFNVFKDIRSVHIQGERIFERFQNYCEQTTNLENLRFDLRARNNNTISDNTTHVGGASIYVKSENTSPRGKRIVIMSQDDALTG